MDNCLFSKFYSEYLGVVNEKETAGIYICKSMYRNIPINKKYYYKIIATDYNGKSIVSYSPEINEIEIQHWSEKVDFNSIGVGSMQAGLEFYQFELTYMERMILRRRSVWGNEQYCGCRMNKSVEYKYLDKYKKYIALINGELVGYCKISDVFANYGNLVVWVDESNRRLGIAESLVRLMINKCLQMKIEPMYMVKTDNEASVMLAKKVGFQTIQRELVVSYTDSEGRQQEDLFIVKPST